MLRAVIYARCSTEEESQKNALIQQKSEAISCVQQKGWQLVDSYVESVSGTSTKKRKEYLRLYEDLLSNKFDIIVIKSQDRLMRNTKDWYLFVDRLIKQQKKLYFYLEQKFYTADDALLTGIRAILAEEYSRELSKKINNAHKNRQKSGANLILTGNAYGFKKLPDKSIELVEEEAEVKRRMYQLCAAGFGSRSIANILTNDGIFKRNGKPFEANDILRIIHNPLNKGTVVMNRLHYEFDTKKTVRNSQELHYVHENMIPATVSDELWNAAHKSMKSRTRIKPEQGNFIGNNICRSHLSGKIFCGLCNRPFYRRTRRRYRDNHIIYEWKCKTYLEVGRNLGNGKRSKKSKIQLTHVSGCDNVHLDEETLYQLLEEKCKTVYGIDKENIVRNMLSMLKKVFEEQDIHPQLNRLSEATQRIQQQMNLLVNKLLDGVITDEIYKMKQLDLEKELKDTREKLRELEEKKKQENELQDRIIQIEELIESGHFIEKASVEQMLDEVEKIVVYPKYLELHFVMRNLIGDDTSSWPDDTIRNTMKIEFGNLFSYMIRKQDEREVIIDLIKENPKITAQMIAEKLNSSLSGVNYKLKALKRDGRICFEGAGGKGEWKVLKD